MQSSSRQVPAPLHSGAKGCLCDWTTVINGVYTQLATQISHGSLWQQQAMANLPNSEGPLVSLLLAGFSVLGLRDEELGFLLMLGFQLRVCDGMARQQGGT